MLDFPCIPCSTRIVILRRQGDFVILAGRWLALLQRCCSLSLHVGEVVTCPWTREVLGSCQQTSGETQDHYNVG